MLKKVLILGGVASVLGAGYYFMFVRGKNKPATNATTFKINPLPSMVIENKGVAKLAKIAQGTMISK